MCEKVDAVREIQQAAYCLEQACLTPLQKLYEKATQEPIPEDMQALLDKLK